MGGAPPVRGEGTAASKRNFWGGTAGSGGGHRRVGQIDVPIDCMMQPATGQGRPPVMMFFFLGGGAVYDGNVCVGLSAPWLRRSLLGGVAMEESP